MIKKLLQIAALTLSTMACLQSVVNAEENVLPDPGNLTSYALKGSGDFFFAVTGATSGSVWGTDTYTLDSKLAVASVHSGAVKAGESAVVKVTLLPGQDSYVGTARNGVTSSAWGKYNNSYKIERTDLSFGDVPPAPQNLSALQSNIGKSYTFMLTGSTSGSVWGTDKYTTDSSLAAASVHAGVLSPGQTGKVTVTIVPGESSYVGTARNGVTSAAWQAFPASFTIKKEE